MSATPPEDTASRAIPDHDPFGEWLASRSPVPPRRRFLGVVAAYVAGWVAGSALAVGEQLVLGVTGAGDAFVFALFVGFFALLGWSVSAAPLALYGNHARWYFRPVAAPFIGAASGLILLLLEMWVFFDAPPSRVLAGPLEYGELYLLSIGAVTGSVTWWGYTAWVRREARRSPEADPGP